MSQFDFEEPSVSARPPAKSGMSPMTIAAGLMAIGVLGAGGVWWLSGKPAKLTLNPIESQTVEEGLAISVPLKVQAEGLNPGEWVYGIVEGPPGARIDAKAGAFLWKPRVRKRCQEPLSWTVVEPPDRIARWVDQGELWMAGGCIMS